MTYEEFRRQLGKAGLTIKEFAELIKQTPNSISNHAADGEVPSHLAIIAALMGDMADAGIDFRVTLGRIEYEPSKARGGAAKGRFGGTKLSAMSVRIDLEGSRCPGSNEEEK